MYSSRDNWERLVTAVVKRQQIWELCHQQSRSTSICSSMTSDDDFSEQTLSFSGSNFQPYSVPPSPLLPHTNSAVSQVKTFADSNGGSSRSITRMLFSAWNRRLKSKDQDMVDIPGTSESGLNVNIHSFWHVFIWMYHIPITSITLLQVATDKNLMGNGIFRKVYKGQLKDGTLVAIKRLRKSTGAERQFQTEVEMFSIMEMHRNILTLRGFCMTSEERFLVYPCMVNGCVDSCLRERPQNVPPLDWGTRKRIAR
ncbi:hypothetical protein ACS0TY_026954 [Phlomoides rotata]